MPYDKAKGKMVANPGAGAKANSKTCGPAGSFPCGDPKHARLAISGATRSANAGNISPATAATIKAKARAALGNSSPKPSPIKGDTWLDKSPKPAPKPMSPPRKTGKK